MMAAVGGCSSGAETGDSMDTAEGRHFSLIADHIPQGVLLSAWTDGGEALMVGGQLGSSGILARYDGERLCIEDEVADGALWWIHGPRDGEWYAVGDGGRIVHETDGVRVREDVDTSATLFGVYAVGEQVWAVGGNVATNTGEIWLRENGTWTLFAGDLPGLLFKTWEGWFVGDNQAYFLEGEQLVPYDIGGERRESRPGLWRVDRGDVMDVDPTGQRGLGQ